MDLTDKLESAMLRVGGGLAIWLTTSLLVAAQFVIFAPTALSQQSEALRLKGLSLEELANVEVTTLSKKSQSLSRTAAAVYVITSDEIVKSGYKSIPALLKHVPGLQVAQIDGNQWAITSRGFPGAFSNKLLVLIDGWSVYSPLFSGVFWDVQDVLLEDIERIEIIRGPGGSLWGANAVNGVINIITKHAQKTVGGFAKAGAGTHGQGIGALRYGHQINNDAALMLFGKYVRNGTSTGASGQKTADDMEVTRGGIRYDQSLKDQASVLMRGNFYSGSTGSTYSLPSIEPPYQIRTDGKTEVSGGNLLLRLNKAMSPQSELSLQGYVDLTDRKDIRLDDNQSTVNLDFNHRFRPLRDAELTWGLGYRGTQSNLKFTEYFSTVSEARFDNLWTAFAQTEIHPVVDRLTLTLGSKVEHNNYTGFEFQPSGRVLWVPGRGHALWAAVSRVVRTPSRMEHDGIANWLVYPPFSANNPGPLPILIRFEGSDEFESERVVSYEVGHRVIWFGNVSSDLAVFYNEYDNLFSATSGAPEFDPSDPTHVVVTVRPGNALSGESYGAEWAVDWLATRELSLRAGYTYLEINTKSEVPGSAVQVSEEEGISPQNQLSLRLSLNDWRRFAGQVSLRYVDRLPFQELKSYWTLDTRVGLKLSEQVEVSLVGQNLTNEHHVEFVPRLGTVTTEVNRGLYSSIAWTF